MIIITIGRVTADFELREGTKGGHYTTFSIAVPKGFGEKKHTVFLEVKAYDTEATRLKAAKVKKGSLIRIVGDLDVREFTRKDESKGMALDVRLLDWSYVYSSKADDKKEKDGNKEGAKAAFDEYYCGDEDDLP